MNAVPAEMQKPPAALLAKGRAWRSRGGLGDGNSGTAHADWDRADPPKNFEEYVRFQIEKNPGNRGAALYLEAFEELTKGNGGPNGGDSWGFGKAFRAGHDATGKSDGTRDWWPGDPLSPEQSAWVAAHQDYIGKLMQMIDAGGPPVFSREELLAIGPTKSWSVPIPVTRLFTTGAAMLAADSQRLRASGDLEGAAGRLAAIYSMSNQTGDVFIVTNLVGGLVSGLANLELESWLRESPPDAAMAGRLLKALDANRPATQKLADSVDLDFLTARARMVDMMQMPLGDAVVALAQTTGDPLRGDDFIMNLVDHPAKTLPAAANAFWMKINAKGMLREYDDFTGRYVPAINGPYSGMSGFDVDREVQAMSPRNLFRQTVPALSGIMGRAYATEAETNVNRAALHLLEGESMPGNLDPAAAGGGWGESPWRDPYTEAPLRVENVGDGSGEGDGMIVYSLGPDMKDQRGMVEYDPTNGTASAGDLVLRVGKRR